MDPPQSRHLATRWLFVLELLLNNRRRNNSTSNNVNDTTGIIMIMILARMESTLRTCR